MICIFAFLGGKTIKLFAVYRNLYAGVNCGNKKLPGFSGERRLQTYLTLR